MWLIPSKHGGEHRLLCGDSTAREDLSKILHDIMLVVTSPPYNQDLQTFSPSGMQKQNPSFVNRMASAYYDSLPEDQYQEMQIAMLNGLIPFTPCILITFFQLTHELITNNSTLM